MKLSRKKLSRKKLSRKLAQISAALIPALTPLTQAATTEPKQVPEQVIVTGTRSEQPRVQIPASIQVVTADQIRLSGASSLVQVLNAQPGIQINDAIGNGGRGASISMRGFGENNVNNVLVLVDGRKLNNPFLSGPNLASIAMKDIERVEIIQGSAGTLYGDQATGGVINIITKRPEAMSAHIETEIGTDDLLATRGSVSQGFDNGLSYRVSAEKKTADNYRDNNESKYTNFLTNVGYENQRFRVFAEASQVEDELNLPGSLNRASIRQNRRQTFSPDEYIDQDTKAVRLGGHVVLSENWKMAAEYADRDVESEGIFFFSSGDDSTRIKTFNPRLLGEIDTANGKLLITTGIDLQKSEYLSTFTFTDTDSTQDISDAYAQVVIPVLEAVKLTVGGRYTELDEANKIIETDASDSATVYQIGAAYQVSDSTRLFLRRDEGFRWATIEENAFSPLAAGEILKPQESTSWELGVETQLNAISLSAVVYALSMDNELYFDPVDFVNNNLEESDREGIVLDARWKLSSKVSLMANYSYVDAEIGAGLYSGNAVPFVAEQTANIIASYQINESWSVYFDAQYTGNRYPLHDDANEFGELGGYTLLNANIRWDWSHLYVNLRADNLTGKEYERFTSRYDYAYPSAEEQFLLTVGYNF
jgi:iron complex outermembrane recepter protein